MPIKIADKFVSLTPDETRCPELVRKLAPEATRIYLLRERIDCREWDHIRDLFHHVQGSWIVKEPAAGRQYFTLEPRQVISRLRKAGVW